MPRLILLMFCFCGFILPGLSGCENTDVGMAIDAGLDTVAAVTLSDQAIRKLGAEATAYADAQHAIAPPGNPYSERLQRLGSGNPEHNGMAFECKVYLADEVNALAMANGAIRIYSGLMDMLGDGEVAFVIGHEIGHVTSKHIRKRMRLAYAARAVRKGIASQGGVAGDLAQSQLGGLVEILMRAQFSQLEEKEADDHGLSTLRGTRFDPADAVSALKKLATLGNNHSFLSSHPAPDKRAERLELQLAGKALPLEEEKRKIRERFTAWVRQETSRYYEKLRNLPF